MGSPFTPGTPPTPRHCCPSYAGSAKCTECHVADAAIHAASKHAHGLQTLTSKGFDFDPYCLKCHTTGYGGPGGFTSLGAVGSWYERFEPPSDEEVVDLLGRGRGREAEFSPAGRR